MELEVLRRFNLLKLVTNLLSPVCFVLNIYKVTWKACRDYPDESSKYSAGGYVVKKEASTPTLDGRSRISERRVDTPEICVGFQSTLEALDPLVLCEPMRGIAQSDKPCHTDLLTRDESQRT